jgi:hypothetical protein
MAIATLTKFTVPLATDQSASTQGMLMPKFANRFRIMFENFGVSGSTTELTKQVSEAARPKVTYGDNKIEVYNSTINLAGKPTFGPITIKLRDDVTGAVSKLIGEQNQKQFDFFEQSSAASGGDYKFTMRIEMLDGGNGAHVPGILETWECYGCFLKDTDYQPLKYAGQEIIQLSLSIQPDNCIQVGATAGFGTQGDGRTVGTSAVGS